jgi:predicted transcriptional regulator
MPTPNWRSVGLPMELVNQIDEISRQEDRSKTAVVRRAIALYREQSAEAQHDKAPA